MPGEAYLNLALLKNQSQTAPGAPDGLVMRSVQDMTLEIQWNDASSNESGFYIERNDGPAFSGFVQIFATGANVTIFQDTGLNPASVYRYRVRAFNSFGNSVYTNTVEITTLNTSAVAGLNDNGTLQDEKDAYTILGWSFTTPQLPTIANGPYSVGSQNVHGDLEADDLWQNLVMAQRTGVQGYADLRDAWLSYYINTYFGNYASDLSGFFGDHTFGWGLVDIGTAPAMAAANTIADAVQSAWYGSFSTTTKNGFNGARGPGRILKLACALGRMSWANDIWAALRDSFNWREPIIGGIAVGYWFELDASNAIFEPGGQFEWAAGSAGFISSFSFAVLNDGLADYFELTGNVEVRRRLVLMARFSQFFGMSDDPAIKHTGPFIMVDAFGTVGRYFHSGLGSGLLLDPFYTCTQVNILTRGYLLTGDTGLLNRAIVHWERSSRATASDTYPYTNRPSETANEVGHFMNKNMQGTIYYTSDGELTYVGTLFKAIVTLNPNLSTPNPPDTLTAADMSSSRIDLLWHDRSNNETDFRIERALGAGAFAEIATVSADATAFSDTGLAASTLFRYQVRAHNNNGFSVYTNIAQDTTQAGGGGTPPTAPSGLSVTAISFSQINLTWTDTSSDETAFLIERCSGAACSGFAQITSVAPGVQAYSDFTVVANTLYRYQVRAINASGSNVSGIDEDTTPATTSVWTVAPNSSWRTIATAQSYITPGNTPDGKSDNIGNILNCWSSGIIFTRPNSEQWLIIKNGGHDSWFWNDVWGYRINGGTPGWQKLRQSFLPYITVPDWDNNIAVAMDPNTWNGTTGTLGTGQAFSIYADGSPGNAHTYDMCGYLPATDECWWFQGAHTNGNGKQAPIHFFSMSTHNYRYAQNWFSVLPTHFAVTDTLPSGHILIDGTRLIDYNPTTFAATDLNTPTQPEYVPYSTGRYVDSLGKMYVFGPKSAVDPQYSAGLFCKVHEIGVPGEVVMNTSGANLPSYAAPGVVWEPTISKFVIWAGSRDVGFLDPATGIKTVQTVPGADPGSPVSFPGFNHTGTYKRFERLGSGSYILMNSIDEIHLLTLDFGGGPPPSTIALNGSVDLGGVDGVLTANSHSVSGSDRLGIVAFLGDNNNGGAGADDITSVTWGGSACTLIRKKTTGFPDTNARYMYVYAIYGPATGVQSIVITPAGGHSIYACAASYTGVKQTTQPDAQTDNASPLPTSSTLTTSLTTTTDQSWIIMMEQSFDGAFNTPGNAGAGDVRRVSNTQYGNMSIFDSNGAISPAASYSMTTSRSTSPTVRGISHILVSFKPA